MNIYLVRHGESELNRRKMHQSFDTALSKDGIKQATAVAERLKITKIDLIYASPYKRAVETAEIISNKLNKPVEYWEGLHEVRVPSEMVGLPYSHPLGHDVRSLADRNLNRRRWKYSDEESFSELSRRAKSVLDHLFNKHFGHDILCVSHGTFIKMIILKAMFGKYLTPRVFRQFRRHAWIQNTGISQLEYSDDYGWTLVTWNDTTHL